VQLLPRERASAAADPRTLSPEGEHFLLDAYGAIKLWTRREPGSDRIYVIHHDGKSPVSATPTGLLSVRQNSWSTVRDAFSSGEVGGLAVSPGPFRTGDLRYSELQSTWSAYDPASGQWTARFGAVAGVEPMLFAVRSPNEMHVRR